MTYIEMELHRTKAYDKDLATIWLGIMRTQRGEKKAKITTGKCDNTIHALRQHRNPSASPPPTLLPTTRDPLVLPKKNLLVRAFHARYCGVKRRVQIGGHNSSSWARRVRLEAHGKKSFKDTDTFGAIDL